MSMIDVDKAIDAAVKTGKVIFGAESAIKNAQTGKGRLIVISANCPAEVRGDIEYYGRLSGVNLVVYKGTSIDLGMACKKPFTVSALTVKEPGDSDILKLIEQPSAEKEEEETAFEEEVETLEAEETEQFEEEVDEEEEDSTREFSAEDEEDLGEEMND
jgi:large subunit ribosomal protein L30e